jgi:phenylpyruvate tautomerase PptA (4-oxalocrotonate tautomerase family)
MRPEDASIHNHDADGCPRLCGKSGPGRQPDDLHCDFSGVPRNWVHITFQDYGLGSGFTAEQPAAPAALTLLIRTGRSPEYKRKLLERLWELLPQATHAPDDQIVIGVQEVAPSQAMEMGKIMPEVSQ